MNQIVLYIGAGLNIIWIVSAIVYMFIMSTTMQKAQCLPEVKEYSTDILVRKMLERYGLSHISLSEKTSSMISTEYDKTTIYLSKAGQNSHFVPVFAVALHEVGHAIQYNRADSLYCLSIFLTKMMRISSFFAVPGILIAFIFKFKLLLYACVWIYAVSGMLTPLMYASDRKASSYAIQFICSLNILDKIQMDSFRKILNITNWSSLQYIFEPFIVVGIMSYMLIKGMISVLRTK